MGYSTAIYAVDLDRLKATVGSGDAKLVGRLLPKKKGKRRPTEGPRVFQNRDGEIFLNGRKVSFKTLVAELRRPEWKGTYLYYNEDSRIRAGRWKEEYSLIDDVADEMPHTQFLAFEIGFDPDEEDEEITPERAAADLVEGTVSQPAAGHQYGYGLELLCRLLGTRLATIEGKGGMLKALKLNTPLSKERSPVKLPKSRDDFPGIGYLTAAEVEREVKRLGGLDLSFPQDDLIEEDREELLRALRRAARKKVGVVAFYC